MKMELLPKSQMDIADNILSPLRGDICPIFQVMGLLQINMKIDYTRKDYLKRILQYELEFNLPEDETFDELDDLFILGFQILFDACLRKNYAENLKETYKDNRLNCFADLHLYVLKAYEKYGHNLVEDNRLVRLINSFATPKHNENYVYNNPTKNERLRVFVIDQNRNRVFSDQLIAKQKELADRYDEEQRQLDHFEGIIDSIAHDNPKFKKFSKYYDD